ncbi:MAG: ClbS/DfsB family four-helix bundle protein [Chloroflexota bacterium]|nr:ClbS/DfsB family four-helix bundle protein [Chloroflexota bacterium]
MDKVELIRAMREAHQRVSSAVEHVPDDRLLEVVMPGWTGKDVLAHMAWWHDHSARVIEALRAGREPYDRAAGANSTEALNQRTLREHGSDPPALTRRAFNESFARLLAALEPATEAELFGSDRWSWLDGEALVETILWDSSRHYDAHREQLDRLSQ